MRGVSSVIMVGAGLAFAAAASVNAQNAAGSPDARNVKNPVTSSAESVAIGQAVYQKNCLFCHGTEATGNGSMAPKNTHPSDLTDAKWDYGSSDGEIFAVIRDGAAPDFKMKGYKGRMSDTDVWNIVNYLRSLGSKK